MTRPSVIKKLLKYVILNQENNHVEQREQLNLQCDVLLNMQQQLQHDDKKRKLSATTISTSNVERSYQSQPLFIPWPTINKKRLELKSIDEKTVVIYLNKYFRHTQSRLPEEYYEYTVIGLCHIYLDDMWVNGVSQNRMTQLIKKLEEKTTAAGLPISLAEDNWLAKYFIASYMEMVNNQ